MNRAGILNYKPSYLEVTFVRAMPRVDYVQYKHRNIDFLCRRYVEEYLNCFYKNGYSEAEDLPYQYDLENKILTVKFPSDRAQTLGWKAAVSSGNL